MLLSVISVHLSARELLRNRRTITESPYFIIWFESLSQCEYSEFSLGKLNKPSSIRHFWNWIFTLFLLDSVLVIAKYVVWALWIFESVWASLRLGFDLLFGLWWRWINLSFRCVVSFVLRCFNHLNFLIWLFAWDLCCLNLFRGNLKFHLRFINILCSRSLFNFILCLSVCLNILTLVFYLFLPQLILQKVSFVPFQLIDFQGCDAIKLLDNWFINNSHPKVNLPFRIPWAYLLIRWLSSKYNLLWSSLILSIRYFIIAAGLIEKVRKAFNEFFKLRVGSCRNDLKVLAKINDIEFLSILPVVPLGALGRWVWIFLKFLRLLGVLVRVEHLTLYKLLVHFKRI